MRPNPRTEILTAPVVTAVPAIGDFMAAPSAGVYRILGVAVLRRAGAEARRYRLSCELQRGQSAPPDAVLHPWRLAAATPHRKSVAAMPAPVASPLLNRMGIRDRDMLERLQIKAPLFLAMGLEPVRRAASSTAEAQMARAVRVGRDRGVVNLVDCGTSLRLEPVHAHDGLTVLRDADVVVDEEPEEPGSRRRQRRARRVDPLDVLLRIGSLTRRQHAAAAMLRGDCETASPKLPSGCAQSSVHVAPWSRVGISRAQLEASEDVREALSAVRAREQPVLTWVISGGSVGGYALYAQIRHGAALARLQGALDGLAQHYFGAERTP
jgi:hypothetical protein